MPRGNGSYIGHTPTPTASAASGIWRVSEAERYLHADQWPSTPAVPGAPTGTAGDGEVSLSWSAPASGPSPNDYIVQYSDDAGATWVTFADGVSTATSAVVTGLTNGTPYIFRVVAVNALGQGPYGSASGAVTPADPPPGVVVDALVIAGGGGGGTTGGGGGGGGYRSVSNLSMAIGTEYMVTVGAGGAASTQGSASAVGGVTSAGGGAGGTTNANNAGSGGSGGGAGRTSSGGADFGAGNVPSTSPSQGNNGGAAPSGIEPYPSGGGGGAGAVGADGAGSQSGNGGDGAASAITGTAVTRAGGGGGAGDGSACLPGAGGAGGGGGEGVAGSANVGGGGGGANGASGASGGSGVVIIRAPQAAASTTGSPDVTTDGSDTVYVFTGSGSITF